ncbi:MAG: discoidin domain-containing protein [Phycisphaerae bacterium]|nr:discoidin domain-containing protein [Phycisphaerae bacterium]
MWIKGDDRRAPTTGGEIPSKAVQASSSDEGSDVANLTNHSGLANRDADGLEEHSVNPAHMWRCAKGDANRWIEFDLGQVQSVGVICLFNYNDGWLTSRGVGKMDISVWTQEAGWQKIRDDLPIEQAQGSDDYDEPMFVKLDGVKAQKVRFDDLASSGDPDFVGLSEVQFFRPRGPQASRPGPSDGATGVAAGVLELTWIAGEGAQTHRVYLGTSPDALASLGRIDRVGAKVSQLDHNKKYFWRIDEVLADGSVAGGQVWNFSTGGFEAWWKLDEADGTRIADSSGNGRDATIHGNPVWQPAGGRVRGALQFDGVDDFADTGWTPNLPVWTVAAWVKSPAAPTRPVASGPVHAERNFQINWNHGSDGWLGAVGICVAGEWYSAPFGDLQADTWYHLAGTYDGENLKAYRDGVLITDNSNPSGSPDVESATLIFGRHATAENAFFAGTIDEVCIFAYALDADEVKILASGKEPSAVAGHVAPGTPHLLQATLAEPTQPAPQTPSAAQAQAATQTSPVDSTASGPVSAKPDDPPRASLRVGVSLISIVVILAVVGAIVWVSTVGGRRVV